MAIAAQAFLMRRRGLRRWPNGEPEAPSIPPSDAVAFIDLQSPDDSLWYRISAIEIAPGIAEISFGDGTPVAAGTTPYLVRPYLGDFYKVELRTDGGFPELHVDDSAPIVEAETDALFLTTGFDYLLTLVEDGVLTYYLEPQI